jgi:hypothetical protein
LQRTIVILFCAISLCGIASAQQLNSFNGSLRYQYEYQDYSSDVSHSSGSTHSPMFNLGTSGSVLSPDLLAFDLSTSLTLSSSNFKSSGNDFSSKTFGWNYYNIGLSILPILPFGTTLRLTDGITQSSLNATRRGTDESRFRRQEQDLRIMTHEIPFLPSISFNIARSHQWSLSAPIPTDQVGTNYGFNLSSGGNDGSVSVNGSISDNTERYSGTNSRFTIMGLHGRRTLADLQNLNYDVNYNRTGDATSIIGSALYSNFSQNQYHYYTTLSANSSSGTFYQSFVSSLSQSLQYIQNDYLRYNVGVNGSIGRNTTTGINGSSTDNLGGGTSFSVQHSRNLKSFAISNGLSLGYGAEKSTDLQSNFSTGVSNGISTSVGSYQFAANHSISYGHSTGEVGRNSVDNNANLNIAGSAWYNFQTQLLISYQSNISSGNLAGFGNHRQAQTQWSITSPMEYYVIPFTVAANGGASWYFGEITGQSFNWSVSFNSPQFFARSLSLEYHLTVAYDPTYRKESVSHTVGSHYQWRAIAAELRFVSYRLVDRRSDLWLTLSRPF